MTFSTALIYLSSMQFPGLVRAICTWPKFSFMSFLINSRLRASGIKPNTVIDCGANVGQFAVASSKIFGGQIYSIEPLPESAAMLDKNTSRLPHIKIFQCCLGASCGKTRFNVYPDSQICSILSSKNALPSKTIEARVTTLDCLLQNETLLSPILLKLDVQGYELEVLRGATKTLATTDYIIAETSFRSEYEAGQEFDALFDFLHQAGFKFASPLNVLFSRSGVVSEMDCLFAKTTL